MHVLAVNSVSTLLNYLSEQLQNTPSLADIQGWNKEPEPGTDSPSNEKEDDKVCRLPSPLGYLMSNKLHNSLM